MGTLSFFSGQTNNQTNSDAKSITSAILSEPVQAPSQWQSQVPVAPQSGTQSLRALSKRPRPAVLDNTRDKLTTTPFRPNLLSLQWKFKKLFSEDINRSHYRCNYTAREDLSELEFVHSKEKGFKTKGLVLCGTRNCPYCVAKHQRELREDIQKVFGNLSKDTPPEIMFGTLTKGYYRSTSYKARRADLQKSYSEMWNQLNKRFKGAVRINIIEATFDDTTKTGNIHYHIHFLAYFEPNCAFKDAEKRILEYWLNTKTKGVKSINRKAQCLKWMTLEDGITEYVTKAASWEIASVATKKGKNPNAKNLFQFIHDIDGEPTETQRRLVREYYKAEFKKNGYSVNQKFNKILKEVNARSDDAEEEAEDTEEVLCAVNARAGMELVKFNQEQIDYPILVKLLSADGSALKFFVKLCSLVDSVYLHEYNAEEACRVMRTGLRHMCSFFLGVVFQEKEETYISKSQRSFLN